MYKKSRGFASAFFMAAFLVFRATKKSPPAQAKGRTPPKLSPCVPRRPALETSREDPAGHKGLGFGKYNRSQGRIVSIHP